jgi:23S rRNA-intervening sequence protein
VSGQPSAFSFSMCRQSYYKIVTSAARIFCLSSAMLGSPIGSPVDCEVDLKDFRSLKVWAKAHALTLAIYMITRTFPKDELYGLTSQMRRCAASLKPRGRLW